MSNFDEILQKSTDLEKDKLLAQALNRQAYNRRYQAKLREVAKLSTLERRIDAHLNYVIGYIKRKYAIEYDNYVADPVPVDPKPIVNPAFASWVMVSANEYKSIEQAYNLSGLEKAMSLKEFTMLFDQYYKQIDSGGYSKL